jgi:predicted transport protein
MNKIKTDHPFTVKQLTALNKELKKVSNTEISVLRGVNIPAKENYADVDVLHSPFTLDVFLSFMDLTIPSNPKSEIYSISTTGKVDYKVRLNMKFHNFSDRIHFFNNLFSVEFKQ